MADLLILEPDQAQGQQMNAALRRAGHRCTLAHTIAAGEDRLSDLREDCRVLTVLNARMPWRESRAFLRLLEDRSLPVLFIADSEENAAHLQAMYHSRCAVLPAPFTGIQLTGAVSALILADQHTLNLGQLTLDLDNRRALRNGRELPLTAQEFELLHALMSQPGTPVSRQELLRTAWGFQSDGSTRTVDVHIQRLRRKIGEGMIETIYRTGYRLLT